VELVAHRAGNHPADIEPAAAVADTIEVDVHLFRRRLEVRHAKVLLPTAIQWERWWIDLHPTPPPTLDEILDEVPPGTAVWLDLKGLTSRLARRILADIPLGPEVTMSSRSWWTLRRPRADGFRTMRSVGSRWQRLAVCGIRRWSPTDGIVVDERLLDAEWIARLRRRSTMIVAWGVDDMERATALIGAGVVGLILDDLDLIRGLAECRADGPDR
jgi:glycerophosphoryl diester phosphodiesterase